MNPQTFKWTPILEVEFFMESQIFKDVFQGPKLIKSKGFLYHWKFLET
jgi:hypothetical protein